MKRYAKPNQLTDLTELDRPKPSDPLISDISVDSLIGDGLLALYREIKNLLVLSSKGKLEPNSARDLRDHLKMLFEIKDREKDFLKNISDEDFKALLEKINSENDNK